MCSRATLLKRQHAGLLPAFAGGAAGKLFRRDDLLKCLGLIDDETTDGGDPWFSDPVAYQDALARTLRRPEKSGRRPTSGLLSGPEDASP